MAPPEIDVFRKVGFLLKRVNINPLYFVVPILCSILAAGLEGLGIGLLLPMLNGFLTMNFDAVEKLPGLSWFLHVLFGGEQLRDRTLFIVLISLFAVSILLKNIFRFTASVGMSYLSTRALHHLRKELFNRYLTFGKLFFDRTNLGHHATLFAQFANQSMGPLVIVDKFVSAVLSLAVYLCVLLFISWKLTLAAIPLFFLLHIAIRHLVKGIQKLSYSITASLSVLGKKVVEILSLIPLVQSSNMEDAERKLYSETSNRSAMLEFKRVAAQQALRPIQELITLIAILFLFSGMLYLMATERSFSPSSFIVYFYVVLNASNKFSVFSSVRGDSLNASGALEAVLDVFSDDGKFYVRDGKKEMSALKTGISFTHLSFSYPDRPHVINDLSFDIDKGKLTAIVGPTGAGKTTLISLLLRYYDCPPGSILMDGTDIRDFRIASLRSHMALVSQETLLLNDTLLHNLTYGLEHVSTDRLWDAIRSARLEEFVKKLPDGLETLLGDRGVQLSGGEKQRVSIARALIKGADILILDEATSSLDSKTEQLIQEAIDDAIKGKTAIVIAHRLSTVKNADKIVVLRKGAFVEEGTVETLLEKKGIFSELWNQQHFS